MIIPVQITTRTKTIGLKYLTYGDIHDSAYQLTSKSVRWAAVGADESSSIRFYGYNLPEPSAYTIIQSEFVFIKKYKKKRVSTLLTLW